MEYKAAFEDKLDQDVLYLEKLLKIPNWSTRQNEHTLHMPTQQSIINIAKSTGFIMIGVADMTKAGYEYQYIYFLQNLNKDVIIVVRFYDTISLMHPLFLTLLILLISLLIFRLTFVLNTHSGLDNLSSILIIMVIKLWNNSYNRLRFLH